MMTLPGKGVRYPRKERSAGTDKSGGRRKRRTPKDKLDIFLEVQRSNVTKAEVTRRHGIHSAELARIEKRGMEGALAALKEDRRKSRIPRRKPWPTRWPGSRNRARASLSRYSYTASSWWGNGSTREMESPEYGSNS